ncbi:ATP-binding protein [Psychromonas antarctica]|uniref:ATP-binding protein n=1 Tax=Psychromonas antarctica TaxID=67573 RepID=UPI001EE8B635|nr:ATP-binding protein [Psychromonas antarctica]MCG6202652.1 ATP-binding protein [Psychromonas antarctica]
MRLTIFHKLFVSLLLTSIIMMAGMALLINNSFQSGLQIYLNQRKIEKLEVIAAQVSHYYSTESGWNRIKAQPDLWKNLLKPLLNRSPKEHRLAIEKRPPRHPQSDRFELHNRIFLLNKQGLSVFANPPKREKQMREPTFIKVPITFDNETVGWISIKQRDTISSPLAESFVKQQLNNFYLIAVWVALFSFVVAGGLVRHFLKPLKYLHAGATALQHGDFQQKIPVQGRDELAELSQTFNRLTETLKLQKETREQWLADISHELRTPIAVLLSEIEAIEDGIRAPEPKYIKSLHNQVVNLSGLVDDLYQLSLSDAGVNIERSQRVDLTRLLGIIASQNEARFTEKNIQFKRIYKKETGIILQADQKSLTQLISNIFENSYRYTDSGGVMQIDLLQKGKNIELTIEDSAPAVPEGSLDKLFQRLYRVDKSRSRASGGSGLGLSICQNIVTAYGGTITAEHSTLGGLKIKVSLPMKDS